MAILNSESTPSNEPLYDGHSRGPKHPPTNLTKPFKNIPWYVFARFWGCFGGVWEVLGADLGPKSRIPGRIFTSFRGPFSSAEFGALELVSRINWSLIFAAFFMPGPLVTVPGPTLAEHRPKYDRQPTQNRQKTKVSWALFWAGPNIRGTQTFHRLGALARRPPPGAFRRPREGPGEPSERLPGSLHDWHL